MTGHDIREEKAAPVAGETREGVYAALCDFHL